MTVGKTLYRSGTISDANPITVDLSQARPPIKVAIAHGSGNVERVETLEAGVWQSWALGDVSVDSVDILDSPTMSIRFTRVSGASPFSYEVMA